MRTFYCGPALPWILAFAAFQTAHYPDISFSDLKSFRFYCNVLFIFIAILLIRVTCRSHLPRRPSNLLSSVVAKLAALVAKRKWWQTWLKMVMVIGWYWWKHGTKWWHSVWQSQDSHKMPEKRWERVLTTTITRRSPKGEEQYRHEVLSLIAGGKDGV